LNKVKNIYFASDFHLGANIHLSSIEREKIIVSWLASIKEDCGILYLVGDVFDFWFEYKTVIPKGFTRLLGKLCEFTDSGIKVHLFTGNHDMWIFDYFEKELGIKIHYQPLQVSHFEKSFYIAHGDGLGPGDHSYKLIKKIFSNKVCQWLFHRLHPNLGLKIMKFASGSSRYFDDTPTSIVDKENEWMIQHSRQVLKSNHINFFVYGHRHFPLQYNLEENCTVFYLGDWIKNFTYLKVTPTSQEIKKYEL
jgi:UDP-2,3-diacylglucosamine hydrolase